MAVPTRIGLIYSPPLLVVEFNAGGKLWHRRVPPEDVRKPEHAIYFAGVPEPQLTRFLEMLKNGAAAFESCKAGEWPADDAYLSLRSKGHVLAAVLARSAAATGRWEVFGRVCREADMSTVTKTSDGEGELLRVIVDLAEKHDRDVVDSLDAKDLALLSRVAEGGCVAAKAALAKKAAGCESVLRARRSVRPETAESDAPFEPPARQSTAEAAERLAPKLDPAGTVESVLAEIGEEAGMDKAESEASVEAQPKAHFQPPGRQSTADAAERLAPKLDPTGTVESVLAEIGEEAGMDKAESEASVEAQPKAHFQPPGRQSTADAAERLAPKLDPSGMVEAVLTEIGEEAGMNKAESETSMEEPSPMEASAETKWNMLMPKDTTPRASEATPRSGEKGAARKPTLSPSSSTSSTDHSVNLSPAGSVQSVEIA